VIATPVVEEEQINTKQPIIESTPEVVKVAAVTEEEVKVVVVPEQVVKVD
jgi:hypothetical protein